MKLSPSGCKGILGFNGSLVPLILKLDNGWWFAVSVMHWPHYFLGKISLYSWNGRLDGSLSYCGCFQVEKNLLVPSGN